MEWTEKDLFKLESIDPLKLNQNQMRFYNTMVKFASMGILPSKKQLLFIHRLSSQPTYKKL